MIQNNSIPILIKILEKHPADEDSVVSVIYKNKF
jgi:hypothetical protein